jgi:hypothetical protein
MKLLIEKNTNKVIYGTDNNLAPLYFSGSSLFHDDDGRLAEVINIDSSLYEIIEDSNSSLPPLFFVGYDYYNNGQWTESPDKMEMYSGSFCL